MYLGNGLSAISALVLGCVLTTAGMAQGKQLTTEDYAHAEKFLNYNVNPLVYHSVASPTWLPDGRFWYRDRGADGITFTLVDPAKGTKAPAFDHVKLANALTMPSSDREAQKTVTAPVHVISSALSLTDDDRTS